MESGLKEYGVEVDVKILPSREELKALVPNDNRSRRVLKVGKNKDGERTKFELEFDGARQTMVPAEPSTGEKYRAIHKAIREASRNTPGQVTFTELEGDDKDLPF